MIPTRSPGPTPLDRSRPATRADASSSCALVLSHGIDLGDDLLAVAAERDAAVVVSPLDSYVTARMMQLAVPCGAVMNREPLTAAPDDLLAEVAERIKEV